MSATQLGYIAKSFNFSVNPLGPAHLRTVDKSTLYTAVNSILKNAKMACATEVASGAITNQSIWSVQRKNETQHCDLEYQAKWTDQRPQHFATYEIERQRGVRYLLVKM